MLHVSHFIAKVLLPGFLLLAHTLAVAAAINPRDFLSAACAAQGWHDIVIKPCISGGALLTQRFCLDQSDQSEAAHCPFMALYWLPIPASMPPCTNPTDSKAPILPPCIN